MCIVCALCVQMFNCWLVRAVWVLRANTAVNQAAAETHCNHVVTLHFSISFAPTMWQSGDAHVTAAATVGRCRQCVVLWEAAGPPVPPCVCLPSHSLTKVDLQGGGLCATAEYLTQQQSSPAVILCCVVVQHDKAGEAGLVAM